MKKTLDNEAEEAYKGGTVTKQGKRMRTEVQSVYNRQVAKCLSDIAEVISLPAVVEARIKLAIEYTCKDVDKLRLKTRTPNGDQHDTKEISGNL